MGATEQSPDRVTTKTCEKKGDCLKVACMLSEADVAAFQKFQASQSKIAVRTKWMAICIVIVVSEFLLIQDVPIAKMQFKASAIIPWGIIFIVIWIAVFYQLRSARGRPSIVSKSGLANERRCCLEIHPNHLIMEADNAESKHNWFGIPRIDATDDHISSLRASFPPTSCRAARSPTSTASTNSAKPPRATVNAP